MATFDVFLSHNSSDKPVVEELATRLVKAGIKPWLDKWNLIPGEPWQEELEEALDNCQTVAVFLGPQGIGPWENEEMRTAIAERVRDKNRRVIPVLLPGASQPSSSGLPRFLRRLTWVKFEGELDDEQAFHLLLSGIKGRAPGPSPGPSPRPPKRGDESTGRRSVPFVGPIPFGVDDADLFFGREECLNELLDRLLYEKSPLLVVHGLSGVGKSSLLQAGLVPCLKKEGYPVAYTSILDSPVTDVIRGLYNEFSIIDAPSDTDILAVVSRLARPLSRRLFLIIDQLERCFTLARDNQERLEFWGSMGRLARGEAGCEVKLVMAVRADWFHAFHTVSPVPLEADPFHYHFPVERLTKAEAREALTKPLQKFGIAHDSSLIDTIVTDLASENGYVNPPQLQIVGEALYRHVHSSHRDELRLEAQDYRSLEGARAIVRRHLSSTVDHLGPRAQIGWQVLVKLVGPDGQSRVSKATEDLKGNLSDREFQEITNHLVHARLLVRQLSSSDRRPVYTLTHDYLIEEINKHFEINPDLQAWKTAERYLDIGINDWRESKNISKNRELLLEKDRYRYIFSQREKLGRQTEEANLFLMQTGLYHGESSFAYWLADLPGDDYRRALEKLRDYGLNARQPVRRSTHEALTRAVNDNLVSQEQQRDIKRLLLKQFLEASVEQVQNERTEQSPRQVKESAAALLWVLRRVATFREVRRFAPVAAKVWGRNHRSQIALSIGSALLVLVLVVVLLGVQKALRGRWDTIDTLFAGPVTAAAIDPGRMDTVYIITEGGPAAGDGATLLRKQGEREWQVLSRGLVNSSVLSLLVVRKDDKPRIYVSANTIGILRSDDEGISWELVNKDLSSYVISSLATHPTNPDVILAGTADDKGVFQSRDGGDSWEDISGQELFASSVRSMVYTPYERGTLLAGTRDGRIMRFEGKPTGWRLVSSYAGVGAINCLVAEPLGGASVYAGTSRGYVLRSSDGGENWILHKRLPDILSLLSMVVVPEEPDTVYADAFGIGGSILWKSQNGGQDWHPTASGQFTREDVEWLLIPIQTPNRLYAAGSAGFFETTDGGSSWTFHNVGSPLAPIHALAVSPVDNGPIYASVRGSVFVSSRPEESIWRRGEGLRARHVREIVPDPRDKSIAFAGVYLPNKWSIYITEDSGENWHQTTLPLAIPEEYLNDTTALDVAYLNNSTLLYAGTNGCGVFHSTDRGQSWWTGGRKDCSLPPNTPHNVQRLAIDPYSPDTLYVAADSNKVFVSTDRGQTWTTGIIPLTARIRTIAVDPEIKGRVYLVAGSGGFWRSDDGARTWHQYSAGLENKPLSDLVVIPDRAETLFVGSTYGEVWKTTNGGRHWQPVRENLGVSDVNVMDSRGWENGIWLGSGNSGGGGIYRYHPGSLESIWEAK